jgi:hypothetical protein
MARIVQAVNAYGPKLELDWMTMRTGLNKSEADV